MNINIKQITAAETWGLRSKILWPNKPINYVKLEKDQEGFHYGLFKERALIAVVSLFIEGKSAQFRKLATQVSEQGKGNGTKLLSYLIEEVSHHNVDKIWCNARADKTSFYKRFGMYESNQTFSKGGIDYVIMEKLISER